MAVLGSRKSDNGYQSTVRDESILLRLLGYSIPLHALSTLFSALISQVTPGVRGGNLQSNDPTAIIIAIVVCVHSAYQSMQAI